MKGPGGGDRESVVSIITVPTQEESTCGRGQGILSQYDSCTDIHCIKSHWNFWLASNFSNDQDV